MNQPTRTKQQTTPGFACVIKGDTELGIALLVAEKADGTYEPVGPTSTLNEAIEIAAHDRKLRLKDNTAPKQYRLWARGHRGSYITVAILTDGDLS